MFKPTRFSLEYWVRFDCLVACAIDEESKLYELRYFMCNERERAQAWLDAVKAEPDKPHYEEPSEAEFRISQYGG